MTRSLHRALACVGLLLGIIPAAAQAQRTTITGRVLNEVSSPLDAASVSIGTLSIVVSTNAEGRYTINVPSAQQRKNRRAYRAAAWLSGRRRIAVTLSSESITQDFTLDLGADSIDWRRHHRAWPGEGEEPARHGAADRSRASSSTPRSRRTSRASSRAKSPASTSSATARKAARRRSTIRGYTSITGNNQPLFVVDGIPVSNADRGSSAAGRRHARLEGLRQRDPGHQPGRHRVDLGAQGPERRGALRLARGERRDPHHDQAGRAGRVEHAGVSTSYTWDKPVDPAGFPELVRPGLGRPVRVGQRLRPARRQRPELRSAPQRPADRPVHGQGACRGSRTRTTSPRSSTPGHTRDATVAVSGGNDRSNARLSFSGENAEGIIPDQFLRRLAAWPPADSR